MSFSDDIMQSGFQDTSLKPPPKKIIICCDGTWQSSVTNVTNVPSNVTRLARYLLKFGRDAHGQEWQQLVYYDAGIGTGVAGMEAKRQGGTGSGFVGNVIEAYNFIVLNYSPGDRIFCFGFSRGAYTARAVAGLVNDIGVIQKRDMQDFPELYRLYQDHKDSHTFRKSRAWREWVHGRRLSGTAQQKDGRAEKQSWSEWLAGKPRASQAQSESDGPGPAVFNSAGFNAVYQWEKRPHGAAPESTRWVEAVGVFDTVGSLGLPEVEGLFHRSINYLGSWVPAEKFGFHNVTLSPYIKHAYHAMALDEHRKPFDTTLWHLPVDECNNHKHKPKELTPRSSSAELEAKYRELLAAHDTKGDDLQEIWEELVEAQMDEELKGSTPNLLQVWFPGVHINVGGGSDDLFKKKESDFEQIAMITLAWMVEQLRPHLAFEMSATVLWRQDRFVLMRPVVDELLKDPASHKTHWLVKKINSLLEKEDAHDPWNDGNKTRFKVLAADALTGWATGPIIDSYEESDAAMKKGGSKPRTPGEYRDISLTCEEIHPTVWYRMQHFGRAKDGYDPKALHSFSRLPKGPQDGPGYEWVKGHVRIPEYKIGADRFGFERSCVVSQAAREFLGRLDKEFGIRSWEASDVDAPPPAAGSFAQHGFQPTQDFVQPRDEGDKDAVPRPTGAF